MPITTVLIPAAGRGQRLDRIGSPKPLVALGGEPLLYRLLRQMGEKGLERAVVVVGHAAKRITAALDAWRHELEITIDVVHAEHWSGGIGCSLLAARDAIGQENFLLAMADHLIDGSMIDALLSAPLPPRGVTMLAEHQPERVFELESAMKVRIENEHIVDIDRHLQPFHAIDAGLFACTPVLFDALADCPPVPELELSHGVALLAAAGCVRTLPVGDARWDDVDTPGALIHAEMRLRDEHRMGWLEKAPRAPRGARGQVHHFTTGAAKQTEVELRRGAVRQPELANLVPAQSASSPIFVFTDETVNSFYGEPFVTRLRDAGYDVRCIVMADGEVSKTLANYVHLVDRVLAEGIDERSVLISLGGGAVCNVCGFIASTLYRGIELVHVPTTLMAQCDAAISHKQGVNGAHGKNLVGSYYAPHRIVVDVEVLQTLNPRWLRDGMAEIIKHAVGQDATLISMLLEHEGPLLDLDFLESIIAHTISLKCTLMSHDPKEHREGMVLQYGHTVGHAVEYLSGYKLAHGESVAVGMMVAARVADRLGVAEPGVVELHKTLIERFDLPTEVPSDIPLQAVFDTMRYNKRYLVEGTRMALVSSPGDLVCVGGRFAIPVTDEILARAITDSRSSDTLDLLAERCRIVERHA